MFKYIFILLLIHSVQILSQEKTEIIGIWQTDSIVGSAWLDTYQFFENNSFIFNFSQYNDSNRILSLKGDYYIKEDSIFLKINSRIELVGGYIERGSEGFQDEWVLVNCKKKIIKQNNGINDVVPLKIIGPMDKIMKIGNHKYYKVDNNPNNY